jgi:hypothetical protein
LKTLLAPRQTTYKSSLSILETNLMQQQNNIHTQPKNEKKKQRINKPNTNYQNIFNAAKTKRKPPYLLSAPN